MGKQTKKSGNIVHLCMNGHSAVVVNFLKSLSCPECGAKDGFVDYVQKFDYDLDVGGLQQNVRDLEYALDLKRKRASTLEKEKSALRREMQDQIDTLQAELDAYEDTRKMRLPVELDITVRVNVK